MCQLCPVLTSVRLPRLYPPLPGAAFRVAGELRAVLSVSLPNKTASAVAGAATNYIYAIGPVAGAATSSPVLQDHAREGLGGRLATCPGSPGELEPGRVLRLVLTVACFS